jgi:hypothetical protein
MVRWSLVIARRGQPIFEHTITPNQSGLGDGAKIAFDEFHRANPSVAMDDDITITIRIE